MWILDSTHRHKLKSANSIELNTRTQTQKCKCSSIFKIKIKVHAHGIVQYGFALWRKARRIFPCTISLNKAISSSHILELRPVESYGKWNSPFKYTFSQCSFSQCPVLICAIFRTIYITRPTKICIYIYMLVPKRKLLSLRKRTTHFKG